jgi:site-specific DNA-cytosine methylase
MIQICRRLKADVFNQNNFQRSGSIALVAVGDMQRMHAIGNSMAVPVMRWIGERIKLVQRLLAENEMFFKEAAE